MNDSRTDVATTVSLVDELKSAWQTFDLDSIARLEPLYHQEVVFTEPAGTLVGRDAVFAQFRATCENLNHCAFAFDDEMEIRSDGRSLLVWTMTFSHQRLAGGRELSVDGCTWIQHNDQIERHRDWFDLGETVYEHIPLLGAAVRAIKSRMHG